MKLFQGTLSVERALNGLRRKELVDGANIIEILIKKDDLLASRPGLFVVRTAAAPISAVSLAAELPKFIALGASQDRPITHASGAIQQAACSSRRSIAHYSSGDFTIV
jgi:hypothetical protein